MRLILAASAVLSLAAPLAACAQDAPRPVLGGWRAVAVTPEVEEAATFAFNALDVPGAELGSIEQVTQQVVAGMNYRMTLVFTDERRWQVQVHRALDGSYALTGSSEVKAAE